MISKAAATGFAGVPHSAGVPASSPQAGRKWGEKAQIPDLRKMFVLEWMKRTKAQDRNHRDNAPSPRERTTAVFNTNQNRIEETKERELLRTEPGPLARYRNDADSASLSGFCLRDVVVFASKQIFSRGFEALNRCYFDFGLDANEIAALGQLFNHVDADKDGRLGINDISIWVSSLGGPMDSAAASEAIKNVKQDGGFLNKLDFVRLILECEMSPPTLGEEKVNIRTDDLLWAAFIAMDANRDGWVSIEDFRRFCRPLDYDLSAGEEKTLSGGSAQGVSWNFRNFKSFIERGKCQGERKKNLCVIH